LIIGVSPPEFFTLVDAGGEQLSKQAGRDQCCGKNTVQDKSQDFIHLRLAPVFLVTSAMILPASALEISASVQGFVSRGCKVTDIATDFYAFRYPLHFIDIEDADVRDERAPSRGSGLDDVGCLTNRRPV